MAWPAACNIPNKISPSASFVTVFGKEFLAMRNGKNRTISVLPKN